MNFRMSLGDRQKIATTVVLAVVVVSLAAYLAGRHGLALPAMVIVGVALGIAWALAPREVQVTTDELLILRRGARPVRVGADEVTEVADGPTAPSLRLMGSGGFFGNFGLFWRHGFGAYWLYAAASTGHTIVLRRRRGLPVVVAADDLPGLRQALSGWRKDA